jgi:hypothetical protein
MNENVSGKVAGLGEAKMSLLTVYRVGWSRHAAVSCCRATQATLFSLASEMDRSQQ